MPTSTTASTTTATAAAAAGAATTEDLNRLTSSLRATSEVAQEWRSVCQSQLADMRELRQRMLSLFERLPSTDDADDDDDDDDDDNNNNNNNNSSSIVAENAAVGEHAVVASSTSAASSVSRSSMSSASEERRRRKKQIVATSAVPLTSAASSRTSLAAKSSKTKPSLWRKKRQRAEDRDQKFNALVQEFRVQRSRANGEIWKFQNSESKTTQDERKDSASKSGENKNKRSNDSNKMKKPGLMDLVAEFHDAKSKIQHDALRRSRQRKVVKERQRRAHRRRLLSTAHASDAARRHARLLSTARPKSSGQMLLENVGLVLVVASVLLIAASMSQTTTYSTLSKHRAARPGATVLDDLDAPVLASTTSAAAAAATANSAAPAAAATRTNVAKGDRGSGVDSGVFKVPSSSSSSSSSSASRSSTQSADGVRHRVRVTSTVHDDEHVDDDAVGSMHDVVVDDDDDDSYSLWNGFLVLVVLVTLGYVVHLVFTSPPFATPSSSSFSSSGARRRRRSSFSVIRGDARSIKLRVTGDALRDDSGQPIQSLAEPASQYWVGGGQAQQQLKQQLRQ